MPLGQAKDLFNIESPLRLGRLLYFRFVGGMLLLLLLFVLGIISGSQNDKNEAC
jgi:hypothetical protein